MAATSYAGPSTSRPPPPSALKHRSDVFRPRFPLDPFSDMNLRGPWTLTADRLPAAAALADRRDVILVLGGKHRGHYKWAITSG
jgi:hypothetical protein